LEKLEIVQVVELEFGDLPVEEYRESCLGRMLVLLCALFYFWHTS